jgi:hypothetical protein
MQVNDRICPPDRGNSSSAKQVGAIIGRSEVRDGNLKGNVAAIGASPPASKIDGPDDGDERRRHLFSSKS